MSTVDVMATDKRIGVLKQPCSMDDQFIGFLDGDYQVTYDLVFKLVAWRNATRRCFFDQREVTFEGTYEWLQNVTNSPTRHLYFICLPDGTPIGTYSYTRNPQSAMIAELGHLIRGQAGGGHDFIYHVETALLKHLFESGVVKVTAHIFADNENVMWLHYRTGFRVERYYPMQRINDVYEQVKALDVARNPERHTKTTLIAVNQLQWFQEAMRR